MKTNKLPLYIFVLSALFLTACSSKGPLRLYDGAEKSDNEIVTFIFPAALDALEFDGNDLNNLPAISEGKYQLKALPGKHTFKVVYSEVWGGSAMGSVQVSNAFYFNLGVAAGSRYVFRHDAPEDLIYADYDKTGKDVSIWIEKENSREKIIAVARGEYNGFISSFFDQGKPEPGKTEKMDSKTLEDKAANQLIFWWKLAEAKQRELFQLWATDNKEMTLAADLPELQVKAIEQLKFWWGIATEKQRSEFQKWAEE